jgi:hypothetical protein
LRKQAIVPTWTVSLGCKPEFAMKSFTGTTQEIFLTTFYPVKVKIDAKRDCFICQSHQFHPTSKLSFANILMAKRECWPVVCCLLKKLDNL